MQCKCNYGSIVLGIKWNEYLIHAEREQNMAIFEFLKYFYFPKYIFLFKILLIDLHKTYGLAKRSLRGGWSAY